MDKNKTQKHKMWQRDVFKYHVQKPKPGYSQKQICEKLEEFIGLESPNGILYFNESAMSRLIHSEKKGKRCLCSDLAEKYNEENGTHLSEEEAAAKAMFDMFIRVKSQGKRPEEQNEMLQELKEFLDKENADYSRLEDIELYDDFVTEMFRRALPHYCPPEEEKSKQPSLKNIAISYDKSFVGREEELKKMETILKEHSIVILSGLGGIGKTKIAEYYVKENAKNYSSVQKISWDAKDPSFKRLILDLKINDLSGNKEDDEGYRARMIALKKLSKSNLIIFDNIDSEPMDKADKDVWETLTNSKVHFIITTRLEKVFDFDDKDLIININAMSQDDQLKLFFGNYDKTIDIKSIKENNKEFVDEVIKVLEHIEGYTLLIPPIAKIMKQEEFSGEEMIQEYLIGDDEENAFPFKITKDNESFEGRMLPLLEKLFKLIELSEKQKSVLRALTLLPPEGIDSRILKRNLYRGSAPVLAELKNKWLILSTDSPYNKMGSIISLHAMIRQLSSNLLKPSFDNCREFLYCICEKMKAPEDKEYIVTDLCNLGKSVLDSIDFEEEPNCNKLNCYCDIVGFLSNHSDWEYRYNDLLRMYQGALKIRNAIKDAPSNNAYYSVLYKRIGWYHQQLAKDNYKEAIENYKKALEYSEDGLEKGKLSLSLGDVYRKASKYEDALKCFNDALKIFPDSQKYFIAKVKNSMGVTYVNLGDKETDPDQKDQYYDQSQKNYVETAKLWEECSREKDAPDDIQRQLAFVNHNTGTVYHKIGKYEDALNYHLKGMKIREENDFDDRERDITNSYLWVGKDYLKLRNMDKSLEWLNKACDARRKLLGENHPDYAWALDGLREWYETEDNIDEAIRLEKQVLEIRKVALGEEHNYTEKARKELVRLNSLKD